MVTPSSPQGVAQGQTNLPLHSFNRRRHIEQPPERKLGYGLENANLQQQRVSLPAATPSYKTKQNRATGKLVLKSQLRYGNKSFESADVEFLSQEFREISLFSIFLKVTNTSKRGGLKSCWSQVIPNT